MGDQASWLQRRAPGSIAHSKHHELWPRPNRPVPCPQTQRPHPVVRQGRSNALPDITIEVVRIQSVDDLSTLSRRGEVGYVLVAGWHVCNGFIHGRQIDDRGRDTDRCRSSLPTASTVAQWPAAPCGSAATHTPRAAQAARALVRHAHGRTDAKAPDRWQLHNLAIAISASQQHACNKVVDLVKDPHITVVDLVKDPRVTVDLVKDPHVTMALVKIPTLQWALSKIRSRRQLTFMGWLNLGGL